MKNIFIASTSTLHNSSYLEYILQDLSRLYKNVNTVVFIPFARPGGCSYNDYTKHAQKAFQKISIKLKGIHEFDNQIDAIKKAEGIFTGGGNTFELVNQLYKNDLMSVLKEVVENGTPYLGTSAGSNICGINVKNTNDMPIVYPPSFDALELIPFNINPHYLDPDPNSKHMGETRETRIKEFHAYNNIPVLGLREGSWLEVKGDEIMLKGTLQARWFQQDLEPIEIHPGSRMNDYL